MVKVVKRPPPPKVAVEKSPIKTFDLGLYVGPSRQKVVIGVDPGLTAPAIAVVGLDDQKAFVWVFNPKSRGVRRLIDIQLWVEQTLSRVLLRSEGVLGSCIEGYSFGSQNQREAMGEAGGAIRMGMVKGLGYNHPAAYPTVVPPPSLKKFVNGSAGKDVKKQQMLLATFRKWGVEFTDDNACDAYDLARVALAVQTGTDTAYERDVLAKLEPDTSWQQEQKPPRAASS